VTLRALATALFVRASGDDDARAVPPADDRHDQGAA